jgi:putative membrane protein
MMWGWPGMMGFGGFGMIFGFIFFVAILVGIIFLIVWLVKRSGSTNTVKNNNSLEILKYRYAKGELTKEQYDSIKKDIS